MSNKNNVKTENPEVQDEVQEEPKKGITFTYVGGGEDSPNVINFMGRQRFVRGKATLVSDPEVLGKIKNNPTFQEGEVDPEEISEYDEKQKAVADEKRAVDKAIDAKMKKKYGKE